MPKEVRISRETALARFIDDSKCGTALESWAWANLTVGVSHGDITSSDRILIDVLKARLSHHDVQVIELEMDPGDSNE